MSYMIYENWPHRWHFTVHFLQWSITFLTEYMTEILKTKQTGIYRHVMTFSDNPNHAKRRA